MKTREGDVLISTYPKSGQFDFYIVITRSINSLDLSQVLVHFPSARNEVYYPHFLKFRAALESMSVFKELS